MNVRAIQDGYYANIRIKPGQKFKLKNEQEFSSVWMEKLSKKEKVEPFKIQPALQESVIIEDADDELVSNNSNSEVI